MTATEWTRVDPIPDDAPELPKQRNVKQPDGTWQHYQYIYKWEYRDATGLRGYVTRYETPTGKETPALTLWRGPEGALKWRHKGLPDPRPIFNGLLITENTQATVVITEGEKCAELLQGLIDAAGSRSKLISVSWPGGSKSVRKCNWAPLRSRNVMLWPDADEPGAAAMEQVAGILAGQGCAVRLISPESDRPAGWDVADWILAGADIGGIQAWMDVRSAPWVPAPTVDRTDEPPTAVPAEPPSGHDSSPADVVDAGAAPFRCLGYGAGHCYFMPTGTLQITAIPAHQVNKAHLLTIAPLTYWERSFGGSRGPNWDMAANTILRISEFHGVFDSSRARGRGAWYDDGRTVLHLGNILLVDGVETRIDKFETKFIYEAGKVIHYSGADPLDNHEANRVREICDFLQWEAPKNGLLMAGWLTIAPICGALQYRPHCWLTGAASWGKSFVIEQIATPLLGEFALQLLSETTAAGARQTLGCDALPVVIDEFEGEDRTAQERIQGMLQLARQSFSATGGRIIKGSQSGRAVSYQIQSCFLMSSVTVGLWLKADKSRTVVLSLRQPRDLPGLTKEEHFAALKAKVRVLAPKWCARFRARAIALLPVIRDNAATFAEALAEVIGSRRAGDQLGALAAGAYSLSSNKRVTLDQALEWARRQDWSEAKATSAETDERRMLTKLLTSRVDRTPSETRTVGEMIELVAGDPSLPGYDEDVRKLSRAGIRVTRCRNQNTMVLFCHGHPEIESCLAGVPGGRNYATVLARLSHMARTTNPTRFSGGVTARALELPLDVVMNEVEL